MILVQISGQQIPNDYFSKPENAAYQQCNELLTILAQEKGLQWYHSSLEWYEEETGQFTQAYLYSDGQWTIHTNIVPDLIYDRTQTVLFLEYAPAIMRMQKKHRVLNDPDFTALAGNKLYTALLFPDHAKPYYPVSNEQELQECIARMPGERVVLKNARGSCGDSVLVLKKPEIIPKQMTYPIVVQEFIDSSAGVAGICAGMHDLRLQYMNDELIVSYIRQPKEGSYLANLAQGGTLLMLTPEQLPNSLQPLIQDVQQRFKPFSNKIYTVDCMFDQDQKPWIIELNTKPGLSFFPEDRPWIYTKIIDFFLGIR